MNPTCKFNVRYEILMITLVLIPKIEILMQRSHYIASTVKLGNKELFGHYKSHFVDYLDWHIGHYCKLAIP